MLVEFSPYVLIDLWTYVQGGRELEYDESLVGARIKVWWPDDAK